MNAHAKMLSCQPLALPIERRSTMESALVVPCWLALLRWPDEARAPRARPRRASDAEMGQLDGKVVLLSGGASPIGRATALRLSEEGARRGDR